MPVLRGRDKSVRPALNAVIEIAHSLSQLRAIIYLYPNVKGLKAEVEHAEDHLENAIYHLNLELGRSNVKGKAD